MTSSQPVTSKVSIFFTPDNKRAYGYSGVVNTGGSGVETDLLEFETNSEYIVAKFQFALKHDTGNNITFGVFFNDILITGYALEGGTSDAQLSNYAPLIIPPFTKVKTTCQNDSSSNAIPCTSTIIGDVYGMTETGYQ